MIAATIFTVYMSGLMAHIGDDSVAGKDPKKGVALIAAPRHEPAIKIEGRYMDPPQTGVYELPLQDSDVITFESDGLYSGPAEASQKFRDFVPSLTEPLTNMLIDDDAKSLKKSDAIVAYLKYPKGDLDIADYYYYEGAFYRKDKLVRTQCVPRVTKFYADTMDHKVTLIVTHKSGSPTTKLLNADAEVRVVNEPPSDHQRKPDELDETHFTEYVGVLKRRNLLTTRQIATVQTSNTVCAEAKLALPLASMQSKQKLTFSENPACTNTDWP